MFMTSKEVHFKDFSFSSTTQELELSWRVEEDLIPYKCDLVQVEIGINKSKSIESLFKAFLSPWSLQKIGSVKLILQFKFTFTGHP